MDTLLSVSPIIIMLICLLFIKMPAKKASALACITAILVFMLYFHSSTWIFISIGKGLGLALFVVLIIWGAMLLYNLEEQTSALHVINRNINILIEDRMLQFIFLSWSFAPFLQGIAGFGVPVIVVTPILIGMGFSAVQSVSAVLVGHCWSICFGSMGSSIYAIGMVTSAKIGNVVLYMSLFGTIAMFCTGLSVCLIFNDRRYLSSGILYVCITSVTMGLTLYLMARMNMFSIIGLSTGAVGILTLLAINYIRKQYNKTKKKIKIYKEKISLFQALLPYILIVILSLAFYVIDPQIKISISYPGYETLDGMTVEAAKGYVTFNILKFPLTIILISSIITGILYVKKGALDKVTVKSIFHNTINRCIPITITIALLLTMAVVMMDSCMISLLATKTVTVSGRLYPLVSPFIGLLGAFITGSCTNANIIFGSFQETAAESLMLNAEMMCAVQSVGASIGGAIGPTTVALGASAAQLQGKESSIYRKAMLPILAITLILGISNILIYYL